MNKLIHEPDFEPAVPAILSPEDDDLPVEQWEDHQEREEITRLRTKRAKVMRLRKSDFERL